MHYKSHQTLGTNEQMVYILIDFLNVSKRKMKQKTHNSKEFSKHTNPIIKGESVIHLKIKLRHSWAQSFHSTQWLIQMFELKFSIYAHPFQGEQQMNCGNKDNQVAMSMAEIRTNLHWMRHTRMKQRLKWTPCHAKS